MEANVAANHSNSDVADVFAPSAGVDWNSIPQVLRQELREYIENGKHPGTFMVAILEGDLFAAARIAPHHTLGSIGRVARFIVKHAPKKCWGNERDVHVWMVNGGVRRNSYKNKTSKSGY